MSANHVLIVGASGLIGAATTEEYLRAGWEVSTISRRPPEIDSPRAFEHLSLNLTDPVAVATAVRDQLRSVTHVVYTAVFEKPGVIAGWRDPEQMAINLSMLRNLLDPLSKIGHLEHVTILQGAKAYGAHLHPIRVPARERYPRDNHENFYWLQEDYLKDLAIQCGFTWTIFRPALVLGSAIGVPMNVLPVIGAFAAIAREGGTPFAFPGHFSFVFQATDVRLIAEAAVWASTNDAANNEHFNVTNGEVFSWRDLWPTLSETLGVQMSDDKPLRLAEFLPAHAEIWDRVVERHNLRQLPLSAILGQSHYYADYLFGYGLTAAPPPVFMSTIKIKEAGFHRVFDTSKCVEHWLNQLIDRRILPPS